MNDLLIEYALLSELRRINREQAATATIIGLDVRALAGSLGVDVSRLKGILAELLTLGRAESYAATFGHSAEDGACRITQAGLNRLEQLQVIVGQAVQESKRPPVGFRPPAREG